MKKIIINSNEFELTEASYNFLQSYLLRTRKYIENNGLEIGLYEDIEERISEKLYSYQSESGPITDKDVIATINEIGESEDIFRDYEKHDRKYSFGSDNLKNNLKKSLYKNPSKGILFGVCQGLGEFFGINPIWFRLFFIATLFFFGTGVIVYLLLAIILPNKDEDSADIEQNIKSAAEKIGEIASRPKIREVGNDIGNGFNSLFSFLARLISIIFFFFLGMFVMAVSIGIIVSGSMLRMGLVFDNQDFFYHVPDHAFYFFAISGITLFIISVASLAMIFRKGGIISGKTLVGLLAIAGIGVFGMLSSFFETVGSYTGEWTEESSYTLSGSTFSGNLISIDLDDNIRKARGPFTDINLELEKSPDTDIRIMITDSVRAKDKEKGDDILAKLNPLKAAYENGRLVISKEGKEDFNDVVPFSFLRRDIILYIPSDKDVSFSGSRYGRVDFRIRTVSDSGEVFRSSCIEGMIRYDNTSGEFACYLK